MYPSQVVGEEGRDDELQEHPSARMEQAQEPGDGNAAARALLRRLAKCCLHGRGSRHGASRAIDEKGAVAMPPSVVPGGALHRAAEALQQEVQDAQRESGAGLPVSRCAES